MDNEDIFSGVGVEISLKQPDDFHIIRESLTRIGVASKTENTLWQSAHILHKRGRYVVLHFKELFILDGKSSSLSADDIARRNTIVKLLKQWNLCEILDPSKVTESAPVSTIKIISFKDKPNWSLIPKYTVGNKGPVKEE
jgi:Bacteriophage translational regulator